MLKDPLSGKFLTRTKHVGFEIKGNTDASMNINVIVCN